AVHRGRGLRCHREEDRRERRQGVRAADGYQCGTVRGRRGFDGRGVFDHQDEDVRGEGGREPATSGHPPPPTPPTRGEGRERERRSLQLLHFPSGVEVPVARVALPVVVAFLQIALAVLLQLGKLTRSLRLVAACFEAIGGERFLLAAGEFHLAALGDGVEVL